MYAFLSALPAILGILGFVVFLILRSFGKGDPATLRIIDKLRTEHSDRFTSEKLTPRQVHDLLSKDQALRKQVGQQDFALLGQALRQQHVQAIAIYGICAALFIIGALLFVYQVNRPVPTNVSGIELEDRVADAGGVLVDLDDLLVTWQSSGTPADVNVYAENLDTGMRTRSLKSRSLDGQVPLLHSDYESILRGRKFGEANRVRIVVQTAAEAFYSKDFELRVGLSVLAVVIGSKVKIAATIDNTVVDGYGFEAKLVVPETKKLDYLSIGGKISGAQDYPVADVSKYDWDAAKLAYLGPDDRRLVRYEIIHS
jgi:hypothetical protein